MEKKTISAFIVLAAALLYLSGDLGTPDVLLRQGRVVGTGATPTYLYSYEAADVRPINIRPDSGFVVDETPRPGINKEIIYRVPMPSELGDVLYTGESATLVSLGMRDGITGALQLDFGVEVGTGPYKVVGRAKGALLDLLSTKESDPLTQQAVIWAAEGVDFPALKRAVFDLGADEEAWAGMVDRIIAARKTPIATTIKDAVDQGLVTISAEAHGYSSTTIKARSSQPAVVLIDAGRVLKNANKGNQNIGVGEDKVIYLPARTDRVVTVASYCFNQERGTPSESDTFTVGGKEDTEVVYKAYKYVWGKNAAKGGSQRAIWGTQAEKQIMTSFQQGTLQVITTFACEQDIAGRVRSGDLCFLIRNTGNTAIRMSDLGSAQVVYELPESPELGERPLRTRQLAAAFDDVACGLDEMGADGLCGDKTSIASRETFVLGFTGTFKGAGGIDRSFEHVVSKDHRIIVSLNLPSGFKVSHQVI